MGAAWWGSESGGGGRGRHRGSRGGVAVPARRLPDTPVATAGWSYLGWLVSLGVGGVAGLATAFAIIAGAFRLGDARLDTGLIMVGSTAALAAVFGVPLFLELSNGRELLERSDVAGQPRLSLAPIPGGAVGTLAVTF